MPYTIIYHGFIPYRNKVDVAQSFIILLKSISLSQCPVGHRPLRIHTAVFIVQSKPATFTNSVWLKAVLHYIYEDSITNWGHHCVTLKTKHKLN